MKLLYMQYAPVSVTSKLLGTKFSNTLNLMLFPWCVRPRFDPYNTRVFMYFTLEILRQETVTQRILY